MYSKLQLGPSITYKKRNTAPSPITMSDTCGDCDCTDKSQCVKKRSSFAADIVETDKSFVSTVVMEVPAAENDGKCKCGASCACVNCTCGH